MIGSVGAKEVEGSSCSDLTDQLGFERRDLSEARDRGVLIEDAGRRVVRGLGADELGMRQGSFMILNIVEEAC